MDQEWRREPRVQHSQSRTRSAASEARILQPLSLMTAKSRACWNLRRTMRSKYENRRNRRIRISLLSGGVQQTLPRVLASGQGLTGLPRRESRHLGGTRGVRKLQSLRGLGRPQGLAVPDNRPPHATLLIFRRPTLIASIRWRARGLRWNLCAVEGRRLRVLTPRHQERGLPWSCVLGVEVRPSNLPCPLGSRSP